MSAVAEKEPAVKTADASAAAPAPAPVAAAAAAAAGAAAGASSASEHGAGGEAKVEVKTPAAAAATAAGAGGESKDDTLDVVIIGGGPAGYSAGLYTSVYRLKHVLYEGTEAGGQLMKTTYVENFPGVGRVNGFDLAYGLDKSVRERQRNADGAVTVDVAVAGSKKPKKANLVTGYRADAEDMGVPIVSENVTRIEPLASKPPTYRVHFGEEGKSVVTKTIIVATGATPVHLDFPNKTKFFNLMSCAVCDGRHPHFKNKPLAIIGGGDAAMEGALFLAKTSNPVYLINRTQHFKASAYMLAKAKAEPNIKFVLDAVVDDVAGPAAAEDEDPALDTIIIKPKVGDKYNLAVSGLFFAIGHKPASSLLKGIADLHEDGYVKILPGTDTATSLAGVHAAGDVSDSKYRQAAVSVGHGVMAAYNVNRYINML